MAGRRIILGAAQIFFFLQTTEIQSNENPLDYYKNHFIVKQKHQLADTLFQKTIWYQKVSHLVIESAGSFTKVTLLMISANSDAYKSRNYPIFYLFTDEKSAHEKFYFLNGFLKRNGVMRVTLNGSQILKDEILFAGLEVTN